MIVQIIQALLAFAGGLMKLLSDRQLIEAGQAIEQNEQLKRALDAAREAEKIRADIDRDLRANPDRVREPDGDMR